MSEPGLHDQPDEALVDLLVKQVTEGLSSAEERALDALDNSAASEQRREFERAAAAITLVGTGSLLPLPPALRARLEERARSFKITDPSDARVVELRQPAAPAQAPRAPRRGPLQSGAAGWLAAAACLLLAVFAWMRTPETIFVQVPPPVARVPPEPLAPPPTLAQQRDALMMTGALKVTLASTKDPAAAGVTGDVVWDAASQRGFLHFVGLSANDPQVHQYQIWIFDGTRDQRYPVDGGVFDVPADATDLVIPIRASLAVRKPAAFAVTIEKPGGVVVSARGHVLVLGAAG